MVLYRIRAILPFILTWPFPERLLDPAAWHTRLTF